MPEKEQDDIGSNYQISKAFTISKAVLTNVSTAFESYKIYQYPLVYVEAL